MIPAAGDRDRRVLRQRVDRRTFAARSTASRSTRTRSSRRSVCATSAAGLTHGFPVSSSGSRTALGDAIGSRTQLYSLVTLLIVLVVMVVVGGPCWRSSRPPRSARWSSTPQCGSSTCGEFRRLAGSAAANWSLALATDRGRPAVRRALRGAGGRRTVDPRPAAPRRPPARRRARLRPRRRRHARHRRLPDADRGRPGWSSTATTRRCASPTPRTSASGRWPPSTDRADAGRSGSCSTPRPTSRSTSPRSTRSTSCGRAARPRHRLRDGQGQAGSARPSSRRAGLLDEDR